jgi:hypothetical protein
MSMKITIGLGKVACTSQGEQISATCGMEIELDAAAGEVNRDEIQRRMARGYATCWQAIVEELQKRLATVPTSEPTSQIVGGSNGSASNRPNRNRLATPAQVKAIHGIARRKKLNVPSLLRERYSIGRPEELSVREASELIDNLKG